jgi:hypothetical protein
MATSVPVAGAVLTAWGLGLGALGLPLSLEHSRRVRWCSRECSTWNT